MERRLNETDWTPSDLSLHAEEFQCGITDKDKIIQTLETEVEQQVSNKAQKLLDFSQFFKWNETFFKTQFVWKWAQKHVEWHLGL